MEEELSPQQTERVRRLLADARHTEPMPADVADRLDRVLTDLAAERTAGSPSAASRPVTDSAGVVRLEERRRKVGRLLLAAAVVVVGGVAVGQALGGVGGLGSSSESSSAGTDDSAARPAPERNEADEEHEAGDNAAGSGDSGPGAVTEHRYSVAKGPARLVRSDRFAADAERLRAIAIGRGTLAQTDSPELGSALVDGGRCAPGSWGGGRYLRVVFDQEAGWLVYRPPRGDTQVVDLFLCGEDAAERSATVPYG